MFARSVIASLILAAGVSAANACSFRSPDSAQTPIPPVAQTPAPAPTEPAKEVVQAEIVTPAPVQPKTN